MQRFVLSESAISDSVLDIKKFSTTYIKLFCVTGKSIQLLRSNRVWQILEAHLKVSLVCSQDSTKSQVWWRGSKKVFSLDPKCQKSAKKCNFSDKPSEYEYRLDFREMEICVCVGVAYLLAYLAKAWKSSLKIKRELILGRESLPNWQLSPQKSSRKWPWVNFEARKESTFQRWRYFLDTLFLLFQTLVFIHFFIFSQQYLVPFFTKLNLCVVSKAKHYDKCGSFLSLFFILRRNVTFKIWLKIDTLNFCLDCKGTCQSCIDFYVPLLDCSFTEKFSKNMGRKVCQSWWSTHIKGTHKNPISGSFPRLFSCQNYRNSDLIIQWPEAPIFPQKQSCHLIKIQGYYM